MEKEIVTHLSISGTLLLLNSLYNVLLISNDGVLRNYRGSFPICLLNLQRETILQIGNESVFLHFDIGTTLSMFNPTAMKQLLS